MKFSVKSLLFVLVSSVLFTSCFEIKEIVHFNKDGSGDFQFLIDMSGMGALMEMAKGMEGLGEDGEEEAVEGEEAEEDGGDMMEGLGGMFGGDEGSRFSEQVDLLRGISGITNVEEIKDEESFKMGMKFSFKSIDALNDAMNIVLGNKNEEEKMFFKMSKKKLERIDVVNMKEEMGKEMGDMGEMGGSEDMGFDMGALLSDVKYTTIYTFDRKVKKSANKEAAISGNKKVVIEQKLFDKDSNTKIDNTIKLK